MSTGILNGYKFTINTTLAKSGTYHYAGHSLQCFLYIVICKCFTVYEIYLYFAVIVGSGL